MKQQQQQQQQLQHVLPSTIPYHHYHYHYHYYRHYFLFLIVSTLFLSQQSCTVVAAAFHPSNKFLNIGNNIGSASGHTGVGYNTRSKETKYHHYYHQYHYHGNTFQKTIPFSLKAETATTTTTVLFNNRVGVEGLVDDFEKLCNIDETIQNLKQQLPSTLIQPLTGISASKVYAKDIRLTVVIPKQDNNNIQNDNNGKKKDNNKNNNDNENYRNANDHENENSNDNDENEDFDALESDITLLRSREELVSLSDVLVVATSAAWQATYMLGGGTSAGGNNNNGRSKSNLGSELHVECQLILDESFKAIRVAWKTSSSVPFLQVGGRRRMGLNFNNNDNNNNNNNNRLEGISEFVFDDSSGKIKTHRILNVSWNGQSVNGPAIGQTLRAIQSASNNVQQSPLLQGLFFSNAGQSTIFNDLRDGFLEQVATSLSSSVPKAKPPLTPLIYTIPNLKNVNGWIDSDNGNSNSNNNKNNNNKGKDNNKNTPPLVPKARRKIPSPGTKDWAEYSAAHICLERFYEEVLPSLSGDRSIDPNNFASNVTLSGTDGSILVKGKKAVADFYESTAFARKSTGGSWTLKRCKLVDWKNRTVSIEYESNNNLPPWTIKGRDLYSLAVGSSGSSSSTDPSSSSPIVQTIQQMELSVISSDGLLSLDNQWLMKNLVNAVESGRFASGSSARDVFTELLTQQLKRMGQLPSSTTIISKKSKLPESAAATAFYVMSDLQTRSATLLIDLSNTLPPAADYLMEDVQLRGYLGETLLRGRNIYIRAAQSFLSSIQQQSINQKRLVVEKTKPPRVELLPNGDIRLSLTFFFRLPPPGASIFLPESSTAGVPIKFELVSDYKINAGTGYVSEHRLVETRINGQLTPGDVLSRTVQKLLNPQESGLADDTEDVFKTVSDALRWFQKISESGRSK